MRPNCIDKFNDISRTRCNICRSNGYWKSFSQHPVQYLHFFCLTPIGSTGFQDFFCCFSRIENIKSIHIDLFASFWYIGETNGKFDRVFGKVWCPSRWRGNLRVHWCESHCRIVFPYIFSVVICFACTPCKSLSSWSRQVAPSTKFPRTHSNCRGTETYLSALCM
jgi:hypothetical protein